MSINEAINIQTTSINAIVPTTGAVSIGNNQTDGILNLGAGTGRTATGVINIGNVASLNKISIETNSTLNSNATPAIAIGTSASTKTIKIGNTTNSVHCSSINLQGSALNNITPTTGDISIGASQTDGILNLGTGTGRTAVGAINIGNVASVNPISIQTNSTLNSNATPAIAIGTSASTKTIKIGNTSNSVHCSSIDLQGSAINNITPTTGDISIGASQTDGILNLGTGASRSATGVINIGNVASLNKISIETNSTLNSNSTPAIAIGTSASTKTIKIGNTSNSVHCSSIDLQGSAINNITPSTGAVSLGNNQTDGILNLGTGTARSASGSVNIANTASSLCSVNILNGGGATTGGSINIATGANQTTNVNIGSTTGTGTLYIENGSNKNTDGDPAIRIGTSVVTGGRVIKIGNNDTTNMTNVHIDSLRIRSNQIDGINPTGGDILIGSAQTTGILSLGGGAGVARSGTVSICPAPSCSANIDMFTNTTCSGTLNIGTSESGVNTTKANILTGNTTGTLTLGNPSQITAINSGTTNIKTGTGIAGTPIGGTVNIGTGTGATFVTTDVNIASGDTSGITTIGNPLNVIHINSGTTNIKTGTGIAGTPIGGTVNIATGTGTGFVTTAVNIATGDTTGNTIIGNPENTTNLNSGTVNIKNSTAGNVNIKNGTGAGGDVNIKNGNSGGGDVNIKSGTTTSGSINIANNSGSVTTNIGAGTGTGAVTIGNSANIVNINGALTMGAGRNITLQPTASYVAPTSNTMLGGITSASFPGLTGSIAIATEIATLTVVKGTYLIFVNFEVSYTGVFTQNYVDFANGGSALPRPSTFELGPSQPIVVATAPTASQLSFCGSLAASFTTAGTLILKYTIVGATVTALNNRNFYAVRIA